MTSVCVNNVATSPAKLLTASYSKMSVMSGGGSPPLDLQSPGHEGSVDFEFLLEDPGTMLSAADELFSDGKLVPLKFSGETKPEEKVTTTAVNTAEEKPRRRLEMEVSGVDPYLFSPRAPRCTVRWRELLGLKRLNKTQEEASSSSASRLSSSSPNPKTASFRHFLNRSSKSSAQTPSPPPPLKDSDVSETSTSISSSRLSLSSSSSSGHELDELPRLSLDLDKPTTAPNPFARPRPHHHHHHLRNLNQQRKPRRHSPADESPENESRGLTVTADSPRLNASGKIVFHGLERSSSSPGNFTGGPRMKHHHGMPRSHSANVRITPVLNVPVSSLRGNNKSNLFFGQLFSSSSSSVSSSGNRAQLQQSNNITKNRTNRTRLEPTSEL